MNINCPGCNFSYKLDERRIPAAGQKMRCPKCSTSFRVTRDGVSADGDSINAPVSPFKGTIANMPPVLGGPAEATKPLVQFDDPFAEPTRPSTVPKNDPWTDPFAGPLDDPFKKRSAASRHSDLPAPIEAIDLPDTIGHSDLPAPRANVDLPAMVGHSDLPAPRMNIDLPDMVGNSDLPAPRMNVDLPGMVGHSDLPAPREAIDIPDMLDHEDFPDHGFDSGGSSRDAFAGRDMFGAIDNDDTEASFGELNLDDDADPFSSTTTSAATTKNAGNSVVPSAPSGGFPIETGDFDLPRSGNSPFDDNSHLPDDFLDGDPFSGGPLPSPASSFQKTILGAGAPKAAGAPILPTRPHAPISPPLEDDEFNIPSPADIASIAPGPSRPSLSSSSAMGISGMDDFGNIDLQGDITDNLPRQSVAPRPRSKNAGSTDFGQLEMTAHHGEDTEEFDAFPVQDDHEQARSSSVSDSIDLADAPIRREIDDSSFGGLPGPSTATAGATDADDKKGAGAFEGRRKYERQSRRTKIVLMLLLMLIAAGGGALHFTPYGIFGVNFLVGLLPSATADVVVTATFTHSMRAIDNDTYRDMGLAIKELDVARQDLPQNEDLRLIGVYLHSWYQVRFGVSSQHEKAALALLGNINLSNSESPYAAIVKFTRDVLTGKPELVIRALEAKPGRSSNENAILTLAYVAQNNPKRAMEATQQGLRERATPRFQYLKALALYHLNRNEEAMVILNSLAENSPSHFDAKLLLAQILVAGAEKDAQKVTTLLNPINEADDTAASPEQKAAVHSIVGKMLLQRRKIDEAKKEFFKAEALNPKDVLMLTGKGALALIHGDLPGAITAYRAALREDPDNIDAQTGVADTLIRQDKIQEARTIIDPIVVSHPNNAAVHYLAGAIAHKIKQFDAALSAYQKAISLNPEYIEAYVAEANIYMESGKNDLAMKTLDAASAAVPGSALIKMTLADGHDANEDYASAIVNLNEALEIEPDNPIIHFKMAQMYRKMKELEDAQNALDEVSRIDANFPGLSVEQGYLMELSGKMEDALNTYEMALKRNPDDISAKTRVAAASIYQNNFNRAKELLVDILNEKPDSADGNFYMGEIFRLEQSGADAVPYLKRATELDTLNPLYFVRYGAALALIHDMGKALQQFNRAMELDPKMAETYLRIGELKLQSGAVQTAIEQFEKSLELNPEIENANVLIGQAYEEIADLKSAGEYYLKATKVFPKDPEGYYRLGKVYLQTKGNSGAVAPLRTAVNLAGSQTAKPYWLPDAYYYLGSSQKAIGERQAAIASFRKYLEIASEDAIDRAEVQASLDDLLY